jgi:hypothetical protein
VNRRRLIATMGAAVALGLAALGGCGLPTDDEPQAISPGNLPDSLLEPSSTTTPEAVGRFPADLWWIDVDVLADRTQNVPDLQPFTVISTLLAGNTPSDVQTSIPSGTELLGATEDQGVLTLDLSDEIATIQGEELKRALAQIVWTATEFPNIDRVQFLVNGEELAVITDEGTVTAPVNRFDFRSLQPPEPTTTSTTTTAVSNP